MSTRGIYGFRKNDSDKLTYIDSESHPEFMGRIYLEFLSKLTISEIRKLYDLIELVPEDGKIKEYQLNDYMKSGYYNRECIKYNIYDWSLLLRNDDMDFERYKKCIDENIKIFMRNANNFIKDSLFCDFAYIFDIDKLELEFYKGYQTYPQLSNRYGIELYDEFYPCRLIKTFSLDDIKNITNVIDVMVETFKS